MTYCIKHRRIAFADEHTVGVVCCDLISIDDRLLVSFEDETTVLPQHEVLGRGLLLCYSIKWCVSGL